MPSVGPGLMWWQIDVLGFNKGFFGTLGQIGAGLSIIGMWLLAKYVTEKPIAWILIALSLIYALLSLPILGMYYGLHHWTELHFGFGAHTIALIDTALESPFYSAQHDSDANANCSQCAKRSSCNLVFIDGLIDELGFNRRLATD